jgi:hypothetical protein
MKWTRSLVALPLLLNPAAIAQSVDQSVRGLETCFRAARLADTICEQDTDPENRLNCFDKARSVQLECLAHVLPQEPAASEKSSETPLPSSVQAPEAPERPSSKESAVTSPSSPSSANNADGDSPDAGRKKAASEVSETGETTTAAVQPDTKANTETGGSPTKSWTISETTSPVDYSALVTAVIEPTRSAKNGVARLTIRCRGKRTELSGQFQSNSNTSKAGDVQVEYQISDQPPVRERWGWSADGKSAVYPDDPVAMLRSIPDGATLKIGRAESGGVEHGATFQLVGLDLVRKRVADACKWTPLQAKTSVEK